MRNKLQKPEHNKDAAEPDGQARGITSGSTLVAPHMPVIGLIVALFFSLWGSFHEIACGCIALRDYLSIDTLKLGCYAFSIGTACSGLVVAFAFDAVSAVARAIRRAVSPAFVPWLVAAILLFLGTGFYACLAADAVVAASAFQLALHVLSSMLALLAIMALSDLPLSDIAVIAIVSLVGYMLVDNVVLPFAMGLTNSFELVAAAQALGVVVLTAIVSTAAKNASIVELAKRGLSSATSTPRPSRGTDARRPFVAIQPLLNVAVYSAVFGVMHVEASMLFGDYVNRNVPYVLGMLAAIFLFYATFLRKASTMRIWPKIQSVVFTLTMTAFLLLPVIQTSAAMLPVALINAAYYYYEALFLLACVYIARESPHALNFVLGVGVAVKSLSFFVGVFGFHLQLSTGIIPLTEMSQLTITVVVFLLLAAVTLWIGDAISAKKLWGMRIYRAPRHDSRADDAEIQERCDRLAMHYRLTPREREVAAFLAQGRSVEETADLLYISVQTSRTHIRNMYAKTDVHSRSEFEKLVASMTRE